MNSIKKYPIQQSNEADSKSQSTIEVEFSESNVQMLATTHDTDRNLYSSSQQYCPRKRCTSRKSQKTIDENENMNKKLRNNNSDHLAFSENARPRQIVSLSESTESQHIQTNVQRNNGKIVFEL